MVNTVVSYPFPDGGSVEHTDISVQGQIISLESLMQGLEPEQREKVESLDTEFRVLGRKTIEQTWRMGSIALEMKQLLGDRYPEWVRSIGDDSTIGAWANVAKNFQLEDLKGFVPSAARLLAGPRLPDAARQEALAAARSGQIINLQEAQRIRDKYKDALTFEDLEAAYAEIGFTFERTGSRERPYIVRADGIEQLFRGRKEAASSIEWMRGELEKRQRQQQPSCLLCKHRHEAEGGWQCHAKDTTDGFVYSTETDVAAESGCLTFDRQVYGRLTPEYVQSVQSTTPATPTVVSHPSQVKILAPEFPLPPPESQGLLTPKIITPDMIMELPRHLDISGDQLRVGDRVMICDEPAVDLKLRNQFATIKKLDYDQDGQAIVVINLRGGSAGDRVTMRANMVELDDSTEHPAGVIASSASHDRYTPEWIWRPGLKVFGVDEYDIDLATYAGSPIPTKRIFTKEDDGLAQEWEFDTFWSNFPYSDETPEGKRKIVMSSWVDKLVAATKEEKLKRGYTLVKCDCRPRWFGELLKAAKAYAFITGAVKFECPEKPEDEQHGAFFGSVLFYFDVEDTVDRFYEEYHSIAHIGRLFAPKQLFVVESPAPAPKPAAKTRAKTPAKKPSATTAKKPAAGTTAKRRGAAKAKQV